MTLYHLTSSADCPRTNPPDIFVSPQKLLTVTTRQPEEVHDNRVQCQAPIVWNSRPLNGLGKSTGIRFADQAQYIMLVLEPG